MEGNNLSVMWSLVKRLFQLKVEDARLVLAERLSILVESLLLMVITIMLGVCCVGFVTFAIVHFLSNIMQPGWAYLIVAVVYILLIVLLYIFRKQLLGNVIARLISRVILEEPKSHESEE